MNRTIIIRRDYLHFIPKYRRYEKRHKNLAVHCSPAFRVEVGDQVTVGQCRPLSKTVRFNVLRVLPNLRVSKFVRVARIPGADSLRLSFSGSASFQEVLNASSQPPKTWVSWNKESRKGLRGSDLVESRQPWTRSRRREGIELEPVVVVYHSVRVMQIPIRFDVGVNVCYGGGAGEPEA